MDRALALRNGRQRELAAGAAVRDLQLVRLSVIA